MISDNSELNKTKLLIVLGMHRSGTSAITRGLEVLGVGLGDNLMPAVPENNEKGFFEDIEINALNAELLHAGGHDWHTLLPIAFNDVSSEFAEDWHARSVALLKKKISGQAAFAIKDPRMPRLLPFWNRVFAAVPVDVSFIIVTRNPISVAESLFARNRLPPEKCHYLWLEHMVPAITETTGSPRLIVDFDRMLDNPAKEVRRMARLLRVNVELNANQEVEFEKEFLEERLRHWRHSLGDLGVEKSVPIIVMQIANMLDDMAGDRISAESPEVNEAFQVAGNTIRDLIPAMRTIATMDNIIVGLAHNLEGRDSRISELSGSISILKGQFEGLTQTLTDRDAHISLLTNSVQERDQRIENSWQQLAMRDERIDAIFKEISERDTRISLLTNAVQERDQRIESSWQQLAMRDERIDTIFREISERDTRISILTRSVQERDQRVEHSQWLVANRDEKIHELIQFLGDREARIAELNHKVDERASTISAMTIAMDERARKIASLESHHTETKLAVERMIEVLSEKDQEIAGLRLTVTELDKSMQVLQENVRERNIKIDNLDQEILSKDQMLSAYVGNIESQKGQLDIQQLQILQHVFRRNVVSRSLSWKLTQPIRWGEYLIRKLFKLEKIHFLPVSDLAEQGDGYWSVTGEHPRFLIMGRRAWQGMPGWYWLKFQVDAVQPITANFQFDVSNGFDPHLTIQCHALKPGVHQLPFYIPRSCRMIRLDLNGASTQFRLGNAKLMPLSKQPDFPPDYANQSEVYLKLGAFEQTDGVLVPDGGIQLCGAANYRWQAVSGDPKFKVEGIESRFVKGWNLISFRARSSNGRDCAKFYFDDGSGFSESNAASMPFVSGLTIKRLFHLNKQPIQVRFDPQEGAGMFTIEQIKISRVPALVALHYVFNRLGRRHGLYKGLATWTMWRMLSQESSARKEPRMSLLNQHLNATFSPPRPTHAPSYAEWIRRHEEPVFSNSEAFESEQESFAEKPLISIIMPVYNTMERYLRLAIESVLAQSYVNWELCIADDASPAPQVRQILEEYEAKDPRIKIAYRSNNGHISQASNTALELAVGEYVALMDHDDELSVHALHYVVKEINITPDVMLIYSDEDKIDENNQRYDPHFKADWNPDLLLSQNYVSHLSVYRRSRLVEIGGFRTGYEGSQDYDLLLRFVAQISEAQIRHIPEVLYHWRALEGSTALHEDEKKYTLNAGLKAVSDYISHIDGRATVETGLAPNTYHVRWPTPSPEPLVSLLIPTRDGMHVLKKCVESILEKTSYSNYEIIILDNQSKEPETHEWFSTIGKTSNVRVMSYNHPFNYPAINNYGVTLAKGEIVGLVNNDVEVISPDWLTEMVRHAARREIGCVGAKLYYDDDTIQHAGVILGLGGVAGHSHKYFSKDAPGYFYRLKLVQNLSAVTAACLLVRRSVYLEAGGMNEQHLSVAFNDVDFCLRVRSLGYRNLWTPYSELYHHESVTRGAEDTPEKALRFKKEIDYMQQEWKSELLCDPAYSINLTLDYEDFSMAP